MSRLALVLVFILVTGCGDDSGPVDSGTKNSATMYSGGSSVVAPAYVPFSHAYTVTDEDGLSTSGLSIDVEGGELDVQKTQSGPNRVEVAVSYTPSSPSDDRTLSFGGKDDAGVDLTPFTSQVEVQGGSDQPGQLFDLSQDKQVSGRETTLSFFGDDNNGVAELRVSIDGQVLTQAYAGQKSVDKRFNLLLPPGMHPYTAELEDVFGFTTSLAGETEVIGRVTLDMLTRDFETKDPVSGDLLHLTHLDPEIDYDTTLTSDGSFTAQLPIGSYAVTLEPTEDKSPLARIFVPREHLDDTEHQFIESGNLIDRGGSEVTRSNYSYLVFGLDGIPGQLDLNSDYIGHAEVVEDKAFVEKMVKQTIDWPTRFRPDLSLTHFDVRKPVNMVVYTGTGNGPCGGYIASAQQLDNHLQYFEYNEAIASSAVVGGNPHNRVRVIVDSQSIQDYADCVSDIETSTPHNNTALFYFRSGGGGNTWYGMTDTPTQLLVDYVKAGVSGEKLGLLASEQRNAFGLAIETRSPPPNKSVMDGSASGAIEGYPPAPHDRVQYVYDSRHVSIDLAFGPLAQYQLNPVTGDRGKNIRLAPQQD